MSTANPLDGIPQPLLDAMLDPERRDQSVVVDGADVRVQFNPEPGVDQRVHIAEGAEGMTMTTFEAAEDRPASYPADLPFLPGLKASVHARADEPDRNRAVMWWSLPDLDDALTRIRAQCDAAGWVEDESTEFLPGLRMIDFRHPDGRSRMVQTTAMGETSSVSLFENPRE
ncbi:hypothetical protein [Longimicrobium sp.]|uniref:VOC family protein n=1 Tax=Longimicrobium sp. TaxID=2029185 RepID=UPI002E2ECE18|nr:hypothetical protein [Longimicrobium sp.]HEX6037591.1 hypothetical protein [Longimicrobium sp.]